MATGDAGIAGGVGGPGGAGGRGCPRVGDVLRLAERGFEPDRGTTGRASHGGSSGWMKRTSSLRRGDVVGPRGPPPPLLVGEEGSDGSLLEPPLFAPSGGERTPGRRRKSSSIRGPEAPASRLGELGGGDAGCCGERAAGGDGGGTVGE